MFSQGRRRAVIRLDQIVCCLSSRNYVVFHAGRAYRVRVTFADACRCLADDDRFLAINRGILVNLDYVESMENYICTMTDGSSFPVNRRNFRQMKYAWREYRRG